jgi:adenylate cyclase
MGRMRRALQQRLPAAAGAATLTVFLAAVILLPKATSEVLRDSAFDIELAGDQWLRRPAPSDLKVIVVDIDRASIDALGTWPWPRETMARIVEAVVTGRPAAIAIDVLFAEPDDRSPAALARRLGSVTGRAEISTLGESLPDGDKRLARAIGSVPVALGFVLDPIATAHCWVPRSRAAGPFRSTICGTPQARSGRRRRSRPRRADSARSRYLVAPMEPSVRSRSSLPPVVS